ncbi:AAA family ATPase [Psychrobacillus sp. FSL H8-0484]|uniref:AAA family ATPase n=1 Tax=Psychrobacillus sp. FSL H8-0484 TaxID=2921390 RepID=UPI0030F4CE8E
MFFLQMSGFPGAGKSTLARMIARNTNAVIVDHDIVKSALLKSTQELNVELDMSGPISYSIDWSLIEFHLSQGHDVIFDCPCLYSEMIDKGTYLAKKYNATYKYVECYLKDMQEINNRLKRRERMISQIQEVSSEESFHHAVEGSKRPYNDPYLVVDSGQPLETYFNDVINYVTESHGIIGGDKFENH